LAVEERQALAQRHAEYLVELAETAEPYLRGPQHGGWLDRLEVEHDNMRAALDWCQGSGVQVLGEIRPEHLNTRTPEHLTPLALGLRLGAALAPFWLLRGYLAEGRSRLAALLETEEQTSRLIAGAIGGASSRTAEPGTDAKGATSSGPTPPDDTAALFSRSRSRAKAGAGLLALHDGDYENARPYLEASLAAARALDDPALLAASLTYLGLIEARTFHPSRAQLLFEEALALYRSLGDQRAATACLVMLAGTSSERLREACSAYRALGDVGGLGWALNRLGELTMWEGRLEEARTHHEEALKLFRETEDRIGIASTLGFLGEVALTSREFAKARLLFQESLGISRESGSRRDILWSVMRLGSIARAEGNIETARGCQVEALAIAREAGTPLEIARALQWMGWMTLAAPSELSDPEVVSTCFQESLAVARQAGDDTVLDIARTFQVLGLRSLEKSYPVAARVCLQECLAAARELGDDALITEVTGHLEQLEHPERVESMTGGESAGASEVDRQSVGELRPTLDPGTDSSG
jgi:tetratricopeptide (TPR) repeat protein